MSIKKVTSFKEEDVVIVNEILRGLDDRLNRVDSTVPTADADETKFSHKIPIRIGGTLYYIMLTSS